MNFIGNIIAPPGVPSQSSDFVNIISVILRVIVVAGFLLAFFILLLGAISWITSGGDEKAVAKARGRITAALIGLILLLSSLSILILISNIFNLGLWGVVIVIPTP